MAQKIVNDFPSDEVLLVRELLVSLVHSSYQERTLNIPESYLIRSELPAFVGRYNERTTQCKDNTWLVKSTTKGFGPNDLITRSLD